MSGSRAFADWIMRQATAARPASRNQWAEAMRAEFETIEDDRAALAWAIGCGRTAMSWKLRDQGGYALALVVGMALLIYVEWHTDEVTVVLALLLLLAAGLGAMRPRRFWLAGALIGWAVPAAHLLSEAAGRWRPSYMTVPPSLGDVLTLLVLIVPGVLAAGIGALVSRIVFRRPANP
jgi:hypothetical protein